MKLVIYGSRKACGQTRALDKVLATAEFKAWQDANGVTIIDCDKVDQPANYKAYISKVGYRGGQWPQIFVCDNALKVYGSFVARKFTAKTLIAKIDALCPSCADTPAKPVKRCPTCGQVIAMLVAALCLSGCVMTKGEYTPPPVAEVKQPTVKFFRFAVLYPFAAESLTLPGGVGIGKYTTSGGAAELVPLVDATGKTIGVVLGTAAKAAVVP